MEQYYVLKKKSDEVEIFQFYVDEEGLPRLSENTILVTQGNGSISVGTTDSDVTITTF